MNHFATRPMHLYREFHHIRIRRNLLRGLLIVLMAACLAAPGLPVAAQGGNELWSTQFNGALGGSGTNTLAITVDAAGNVYAAGSFTWAASNSITVNRVAKWNGTAWQALGSGFPSNVEALAVDSNGILYAGGSFTSLSGGGGTMRRIAKWDGTSWTQVGFGLNSNVYAIVPDDQGNIYVGGSFDRICNDASCSTGLTTRANRIAKWNGTSWSTLGFGLGTANAVNALVWDGGTRIYAAGDFSGICTSALCSTVTTTNRIAQWDGTAWSALSTGITGGASPTINALAVAPNKNIYAAGKFTTAGGVAANRIAEWDGAEWAPLSTGVSNTVESMVVDWAGNVYIGGSFAMAGGVSAAGIAKWDGATWSAMGSGVTGSVFSLALPSHASSLGGGSAACLVCAADVTDEYLYTGGNFAQAGGGPSDRFGAWAGIPEEATYVEMVSFRAHTREAGVEITWQTALELDNAGFHLYRSDSPTGPWTRADHTLIAALGSGSTYHFVDPVPARYYKLEDIDTAGISAWHGPIAVEGATGAGTNPVLFLPMLQTR